MRRKHVEQSILADGRLPDEARTLVGQVEDTPRFGLGDLHFARLHNASLAAGIVLALVAANVLALMAANVLTLMAGNVLAR